MLQPGERIGPLRIERPLGAGGMGEVWLARDERLERLVAVKLLPADRSVDPAARGRMLREARAASALRHPGIVTVHDIGDHDGRAYIVMEFVEGETFDALVRRRGRVSPAEAVDLVAQVADAVAVAHTAGILHRDLKAANLMIDGARRVKVLDFGLSKRTEATSQSPHEIDAEIDAAPVIVRASGPAANPALAATALPDSADAATTPAPATGSSAGRTDEPQTAFGARMGTPGWAPPELIDGRPSDVRSDVYSLGVVLYHLLCGRMPFPGTSWAELREQCERPPTPPSRIAPEVPRALDEVVLAALDPDPSRRPASVTDLVARARAALAPARSRAWMAAGVGAVVLGGGVLAALAMTRDGDRGATPPAAPIVDAAPAAPPAPPVPLTRLGGCAYSPAFLDADTLSFDLTRDGTVDLYTLDLGGEPVRRTDAAGWEWRSVPGRDAGELLFMEDSDTGAFAVRLDLDTGATTRLFPSAGPVAQAGDSFFYAPSPANVLRRRQGTRDEAFLSLPAGNAIDSIVRSHDSTRLALMTFGDNQPAQVCVTPVDRADLRCLEAHVGSSRPGWSTRGDAVYVFRRHAIDRLPLDGGDPTVAIGDVVATGGIAVSPDGARLVYSDCITRGQLHEVPGDLSTTFVDEKEANHPVFGPGGRLAYVAKRDHVERVMVREPDGTLRELAAHADARITGVAFSKDGEQIAYVVGSHAEPGIYVVHLHSGAMPNRITEGAGDRNPEFVGEGLVFTRTDETGSPRLMRTSLDGSTVEIANRRPRETFAVDHARGRVLLSSPAGDFLYWWDAATGTEEKGPTLPQPIGDIAISPEGRWLLLLQGANGDVTHRMRLDGTSKLEKIHDLPGDLTSTSGAIDDDGRAVIVVFRWTGELWRVDAPAGRPW